MAGTLTRLACDASNQCTQQVTNCSPYTCNGTTACNQSCATPADCAPTFHCNGTTCEPM